MNGVRSMLLVCSTSKGLVALDFISPISNHFNVCIGVFDEAGWMGEPSHWAPYDESKDRLPLNEELPSLGSAIARATTVPEAEAIELANQALREWRERGGEDVDRGDALKGLAFITVAGTGIFLAIAAAVALLILLVILVARIV